MLCVVLDTNGGPGARPPSVKLSQLIAWRCDQHAGTPGLAPNSLVGRACFRAVVVSGVQLPIVDHELAMQQVQLLETAVSMRRIVRPGREADEHADAVVGKIRRQ